MKKIKNSNFVCLLVNFVLAYTGYMICRLAFLAEHWNTFSTKLTFSSFTEIIRGGLLFDTSAILYTNVLYTFLMLVPLHTKENRRFHSICRWIFIVVNSLCFCTNLADAVYFTYTGRRTTATIMQEFSNEGNLGSIVGMEFINHWYLVVVAVALIYGLYRFSWMPNRIARPKRLTPYYIRQTLLLLLFVPLCICGMRGGISKAVRPITISNANQYVDSPQETALVLNTPFSLIRTLGKSVFTNPNYFSKEELDALYSPLHKPGKTEKNQKNVVVLIVEGFGREYIGKLNTSLEDGKYKGYTPFVDSLLTHCATWEYTFCNGRKSIDGMPSILSSVPMLVEPFFLTPYSINDVSGLAKELGEEGYYSAFFHGAENGSMGFQAFAHATGFNDYFGRTEYDNDSRFGGSKDFDGTWAIWDEPFLQFMVAQMETFKQPFLSTVFTATSHHPFVIPKEYQSVYPEGDVPVHKCIRYTDHALQLFFEKAKQQPWYENTLFILTSDHTSQSAHDEYQTDLGLFCSPILFFDPSGDIQPGMRPGIAQHIDILPTVLNYLGVTRPYLGFGIDLFYTPAADTWAISFQNGIYQFVKGDYLLQFDGQQVRGIFDIRKDWMLQHNLKGGSSVGDSLEKELKAIIQSYMDRMVNNELIVRK